MLRKNNIHFVVALIGLIGCSSSSESDYVLDDTDSEFQEMGTSSDGGPGNIDPLDSDTELDSLDTKEMPGAYTCTPPQECVSNIACRLRGNQPVTDKTCPEGQVCCGPSRTNPQNPQTTDTSKPFCRTGGRNYQCQNNIMCMISGGRTDNKYRCSNTEQICCNTGGQPGTSTDTGTNTDTDTDTRTNKPLCSTAGDGYECVNTFRCRLNGGTVDDDYRCDSTNAVCCNVVDEADASIETDTQTDTPTDTPTDTETDTGTERTECPDEYSCVRSRECSEPGIIHDEFICSRGFRRVCCEEYVDIDAGILDSGL